jgi:hypothetical protein
MVEATSATLMTGFITRMSGTAAQSSSRARRLLLGALDLRTTGRLTLLQKTVCSILGPAGIAWSLNELTVMPECRNILVRYCAHVPRNFQYRDGVQVVSAALVPTLAYIKNSFANHP